ncbi:C-type lectin domain family 2 member B-like [Pituophis catenifer annectens]|uniref:C-type lectin domain family 2 member B-like n=1 Tax=Pituophis catenifer annectens TaxID=94852 RepID=UPI003995271A
MAGGKRDEQAHPSKGYDHPSNGYDPVQEEEKDCINLEMQNIDEEQVLQRTSPNGNAGGQEEKSEQKSSSACSKYGKPIIVIVILVIIICILIARLSITMQNQKIQAVQTGHIGTVTCPPDWIGYQGHCYKLSGEKEEKNWNESQNFCILHNASLAKITQEEMNFVTNLTRNHVFWIGLKKEPDQPWKWLDGEHSTMKVLGNGADCAFLNDDATASSGRCSTEHRYICKKTNDPKRS